MMVTEKEQWQQDSQVQCSKTTRVSTTRKYKLSGNDRITVTTTTTRN